MNGTDGCGCAPRLVACPWSKGLLDIGGGGQKEGATACTIWSRRSGKPVTCPDCDKDGIQPSTVVGSSPRFACDLNLGMDSSETSLPGGVIGIRSVVGGFVATVSLSEFDTGSVGDCEDSCSLVVFDGDEASVGTLSGCSDFLDAPPRELTIARDPDARVCDFMSLRLT